MGFTRVLQADHRKGMKKRVWETLEHLTGRQAAHGQQRALQVRSQPCVDSWFPELILFLSGHQEQRSKNKEEMGEMPEKGRQTEARLRVLMRLFFL